MPRTDEHVYTVSVFIGVAIDCETCDDGKTQLMIRNEEAQHVSLCQAEAILNGLKGVINCIERHNIHHQKKGGK